MTPSEALEGAARPVARTGFVQPTIGRTLLAGVAGGMAMNVVMLLTFRLLGFGWSGGGLLLDPARQSPKLIAVWAELEPLPRIVAEPAPLILGLLLFAIGHAFVYRWLAPNWPPGVVARALRISGLLRVFPVLGVLHAAQPVRRTRPIGRRRALVLGGHRPRRGLRDRRGG